MNKLSATNGAGITSVQASTESKSTPSNDGVSSGLTQVEPVEKKCPPSRIAGYRSAILHFTDAPNDEASNEYYQYWSDGLLVVKDGKVAQVGPAAELLASIKEIEVTQYPNALIVPGFIDTHTHYPQMYKMASYGQNLIEWLNQYIFPEEKRFSDADYASEVAEDFLDALIENGTTTAMIFCTVHAESVDAIFQAAQKRDMRIIAGKVLMDRVPYAPADLSDSAEQARVESQQLIDRWHNKGRAAYAVTPRFAPTSTPEQLKVAGELLAKNPTVYLQTHLSESEDELKLVASLYPEYKDYVDVYDQHQLVTNRSVFAHAIHPTDREWQRLGEAGSAVSCCPSSNFYLGSGVPNMKKASDAGVKVSIGTDIGAGTTFSMLKTLGLAYKADHLHGQPTSPLKSFYLATLGGAKALNLEDEIGSFKQGCAADFVVMDLTKPKELARITERASSLIETLSALRTLGDDRTILETFIMGVPQKGHEEDGELQPGDSEIKREGSEMKQGASR